ncbi:hypothetical protein ACT17Q_11335 [Cellulomonas sp. CW35]|uniref:Uncharacterized protein n=1 Tax=Cellulomonas uda TaxID=1714 RepID=A0A4Y3KGC8_CELUD|nr:hypothetical protein [Cellulomonas uda]NII66859.1 hypothetical protein [Cellulomonas uda]GEA82125.1 hypothetical protein CUD01_25690 [Cellulomonas uda]
MSNDLHFHIPQGFTGTITVGQDGQVTVTSAAPEPAGASHAWPDLAAETAEKLEEMLQRQKDYDPSTRSRDVAKVLLDRGWSLYSVNLKGGYVLFTYAGDEHGVSLYLSSLDLNNTKASQREFMMSLPGVDVHKSDVRVPINGKHFDQALDSIAAIEKWADG